MFSVHLVMVSFFKKISCIYFSFSVLFCLTKAQCQCHLNYNITYHSDGCHWSHPVAQVLAPIFEMNIVVWTRISAVWSQIDWKQISYCWRRETALVIRLCRVLRILCPVLVQPPSARWIPECCLPSSAKQIYQKYLTKSLFQKSTNATTVLNVTCHRMFTSDTTFICIALLRCSKIRLNASCS